MNWWTAPGDTEFTPGTGSLLKEFVEGGTHGRLTVQIFPAGQLGNEREIIEGVKLGTLEVGLVASAPLAGFSNAFLLFDLPFLFNDAAHARRVLDGPIGERVAKTLEPHGIRVLAYLGSSAVPIPFGEVFGSLQSGLKEFEAKIGKELLDAVLKTK